MSSKLKVLAAVLFSAGIILSGVDCPLLPPPVGDGANNTDNTDGVDNTNGTTDSGNNGTNSGPSRAVLTGIRIDFDGQIGVGDGLLAYVKDKAAAYFTIDDGVVHNLTGSFDRRFVYASGKKIVLLSDATPGQLSVYDTTTAQTATVPDVSVSSTYTPAGDGDFVAVPEGNHLKVIDISGASPAVTTFFAYLGDTAYFHPAGGKVLVGAGGALHIFSAAGPADQLPTTINDAALASGTAAVTAFDGQYALVSWSNGSSSTQYLWDTTTSFSNLTTLPGQPSQPLFDAAIRGGSFAYFLSGTGNVDSTYGQYGNKLAFGAVAQPSAAGSGPGTPFGQQGVWYKGGWKGFGRAVAIAPNGTTYVGGACEDDHCAFTALQKLNGTDFEVLEGTQTSDRLIQAADAVATNDLVAFKVLTASQSQTEAALAFYVP